LYWYCSASKAVRLHGRSQRDGGGGGRSAYHVGSEREKNAITLGGRISVGV
jgi:hypothetical protein